MIRAALYARVSTTQHGQDTRVQLDQLREVAARRGWTIAGEFVDDGISGAKSRAERPALSRLVKAVTRGEVDLVAAWSVDRLGRSLQDLLGFLGELHAARCDLYLHQQGLDTSTPAGRAMFQIMGVFSEFERAMIRERVLAGLERARRVGTKSGRPIGRPPTDPEKLAAIERAITKNDTVRQIARDLKVRPQTVIQVRRRLAESGVLAAYPAE